jgi:dephospho-CoA kinase
VAILGLTGGVATGKSTFARRFLLEFPMSSFDSDQYVHDLLASDDLVRQEVVSVFGPEILGANGWPDRLKLRQQVFGSETRRKALEGILHPRVRDAWREAVAKARKTDAWQLVDIPLLYESGVQSEFDRVIVVAAPYATQMHRLVQERNLAPAMAGQIIAAQLDLGAKTQQADHVIWNDSTVSNLDGQIRLLAAWLRRRLN